MDVDPVDLRSFSITPEAGQGADLRAVEVDTAPALSSTTESSKTDRGIRVVQAATLSSKQGSGTNHHFGGAVDRALEVGTSERNGGRTDRCALDLRPDGPRYAGCGDAVTANVAEWIGRRLNE